LTNEAQVLRIVMAFCCLSFVGFNYERQRIGKVHTCREDMTMATGWAQDGAVQEQIDDTVEEAVQRARSQLPSGKSLSHCEECGAAIPQARRNALPGVRLCVLCQTALDEAQAKRGGFNRRGSKDSQLR
jgi:phage/conjugal plasmid C-4 type zinc finger TraR family protein